MAKKILIAFYSRSGVTKKACLTLMKILADYGAEVACEEIIDHKDRSGMGGWCVAGKDAALKKTTVIDLPKNNPAEYDLLVLAMPVWAFTFPPAIRAYLEHTKNRLPAKVAGLCTEGGSGDKKTFADMEKAIEQMLLATATLIDKKVQVDSAEEYIEPLNVFARKLTSL